MKNMLNIIIAPHPDDELIGCYEIIRTSKTKVLVEYREPFDGRKPISNTCQIGSYRDYIEKGTSYCEHINLFFPDPIYEVHPDHRAVGAEGEKLARLGYRVFFYSVNMQAPYIRKVRPFYPKKIDLLNFVYPDKADLWKYDHKYFLFEGQCRWVTYVYGEVNGYA